MARGQQQSTRRFGVEIEAYNVTHARVVGALRAAGIECHDEGYNHATRPHWKVVTDGSLHGLNNPFELVSPPLSGAAGLEQVRKVSAALVQLGAKVNKQCGLHVHVDATDLTIADFRALCVNFVRYEACFDKLVAPSRRANNYAKSTRGKFRTIEEARDKINARTTLRDLTHLLSADRYHKLNLCAYDRHHTVEFRQHQGTVEAEKMIAWIGLVVGFVEKARLAARTNRVTINGANGIRDFLKCAPAGVRPFLLARYEAFKAAGDQPADASADAIANAAARLDAHRATVREQVARANARRLAAPGPELGDALRAAGFREFCGPMQPAVAA